MGNRKEPTRLPRRNAAAEWDHVPSDLVIQGADTSDPIVTIAIPTFRRLELLVETVQSALNQRFDKPYEILIVDNDPPEGTAHALLERLPILRERNFRYYVNRENMGIFPNHNRCVQLARAEWVTILNDDDMLDPEYLALMFAELRRRPEIDGLVCHKRSLDERHDKPDEARSFIHKSAVNLLNFWKFAGLNSRRIDASKLFWWPGGVVGNPAGFIFRKRAALEIGGFYPDEGMCADYWLYARFAESYHLRQHKANAATIRIGRNESLKPATLETHLVWTYQLQQALAKGQVPRYWARFSPLILARQRAFYRDFWQVDLAKEHVENLVGTKLTNDRPLLYKATRLLFRGY